MGWDAGIMQLLCIYVQYVSTDHKFCIVYCYQVMKSYTDPLAVAELRIHCFIVVIVLLYFQFSLNILTHSCNIKMSIVQFKLYIWYISFYDQI